MSYDATFAHELRAAKEQGYKQRDACTVARQRAKRQDPRATWSFVTPTEEEIRAVEEAERAERVL